MKLFKYIITWLIVVFSLVGFGVGLYFMYEIGYSLVFVLLAGFYSLNFISSLVIFVQNRQMQGKIAWMVMFLFLPFIGHVVFAVFGQRYKQRVPLDVYRSKRTFKHEILTNKAEKNETELLNKVSKFMNRGLYNADVQIFSTGDKGYEELFKDLENAKKYIHLQYYIIKPGEIFDHLKDILLRKAAEGVEIRFIVDDFGRWAVPYHEIKELEDSGIQIKIFQKVYFPFLGSSNGYRLHRKAAIIDGNIVHTGGLNIADEYANLNKNYGLWMDYQIRIEGEAVRSYVLLYADDWFHLTDEHMDINKYLGNSKKKGSKLVMIEDSPEVMESLIQDSIISMISNAKKTITLTTPYLVPTPELFTAIRTAALSGVKVKIIIPGKPDKKAVIIATKYYASLLSNYGVEIYEAQNLLIHSKIGLFDDEYAYVGTANLDTRSLISQWEVNQLLTGKIVGDIKSTIDEYMEATKLLTNEQLKMGWFKEIISRAYVNLFSPIM